MIRVIRISVLFALLSALPLLAQTPFSGSPVQLPGTVQAENFDNGGQNVAYFDTTPGNLFGSVYRTTDVDIGTINAGGFHLGVIDPGEWTRYLVNVSTSGSYTLGVRYSSAYPNPTTFRVLMDGADITGTQSITSTGDWQAYATKNITVNLTAGTNRVLRVQFETGTFNLDSLQFTSSACSKPTITSHPVASTVRNVGQGHVITLTGGASGATSYRWYRDGVAVTDLAGRFSGATTTSLTLSTLEQGIHGGNYRLRATNACGFTETNASFVRVTCGGNPGLMIEDIHRALQVPMGLEYCYWQEDLQQSFVNRSLLPSNNDGGDGSFNRPVLAGAVAYVRNTDPSIWTPWWQKYLRSELGEQSPFQWYWGGQELGSFSYQYLNVASVLAVHFHANRIGDTTTAALARRWLRATFALQALAAGGPLDPATQKAQDLTQPVSSQVVYNGPWIAMAGMRSFYKHWVGADRNILLATAIGYTNNEKGENPSVKAIRGDIASFGGVYGFDSTDRTELRALVDASTLPANFMSRFIPSTLRTQAPYHFVGWGPVKATLMEYNTHKANPPTFGVVYYPAQQTADFLYPWAGVFTGDIQNGVSRGRAFFDWPNNRMGAANDGAPDPPHPAMTDYAALPTTPRSFWLKLSPTAPPVFQ
jgi:Carbohydrate binding module (family 6)